MAGEEEAGSGQERLQDVDHGLLLDLGTGL